ncbi:MAG: hypothetical protein IJK97_12250 [Thermoguttaceae bacterium]|nr:hypothetical protein [Thermoguttaceae bacterium]MBQ9456364.1 hypothetical protein [Thermoguttaceae bacterium]
MNENRLSLHECAVEAQKTFFQMMTVDEVEEADFLIIEGYRMTKNFVKNADFSILKGLTNLKTLEFSHCTKIRKEHLSFLPAMEQLEEIHFEKCNINPNCLEVVSQVPNLKSLILHHVLLPESAFEPLRGNTNLKELEIFGLFNLSEDFLGVLESLQQLEDFCLIEFCQKWEPVLAILSKFQNLKTLSIGPNVRLGLRNCELLKQMKALESLHLLGIPETTDMGLKFLEKMPMLKDLTISNVPFLKDLRLALPALEKLTIHTSRNLKLIDFSLLPNLKSLVISGEMKRSDKPCQKIELKDFDSLSQLNTLKLSLVSLSKKDFRALEMLTNLKSVEYMVETMTDEDLAFLAGHPELERLVLNIRDGMMTRGPEVLGEMPALKKLVIRNAGFLADSGMRFVKNMPVLEELQLFDCKVTDEDLFGISEAEKLETLEIEMCQNVTETGLNALNRLMNIKRIDLSKCRAEHWKIQGFPQLKSLDITNFQDLTALEVCDVPNLHHINVICSSPESFTLRNLPSLRVLIISGNPSLNCMRMSGIPCIQLFAAEGSDQLDLTGLGILKTLQDIVIGPAQMNQEGVMEALQELPQLHWLTIVSPQEIKGLREIYEDKDDEESDFDLDTDLDEEPDEHAKLAFTIDEEERIEAALPHCDISFSLAQMRNEVRRA